MKEDNNYSNLPQIIDVPVEADIDFELREPEEEIEGIKKDITEDIWQTEQFVEVEAIEHIEAEVQGKEVEQVEKVEPIVEEKKKIKKQKDTSFQAFKANQQAGERRFRQKLWATLRKSMWWMLAIVVGLPLIGAGGFALVVGGGFAAFFCGVGVVGGIAGVAVGTFMLGAEMGALGMVILFGSLIGIGGGGLGILLIIALCIGIKNLVVAGVQKVRGKKVEEAN